MTELPRSVLDVSQVLSDARRLMAGTFAWSSTSQAPLVVVLQLAVGSGQICIRLLRAEEIGCLDDPRPQIDGQRSGVLTAVESEDMPHCGFDAGGGRASSGGGTTRQPSAE